MKRIGIAADSREVDADKAGCFGDKVALKDIKLVISLPGDQVGGSALKEDKTPVITNRSNVRVAVATPTARVGDANRDGQARHQVARENVLTKAIAKSVD